MCYVLYMILSICTIMIIVNKLSIKRIDKFIDNKPYIITFHFSINKRMLYFDWNNNIIKNFVDTKTLEKDIG